jgi:prepilin-type N-terminal cleavage/methylation domain-containing protein/prepilin-type processing-associated H-X9-DG protein
MKDRKAFTLIELLVVISVIVMLIALLLPALQLVKKQAQAVVCQTRLRHLGQLAAMRAHDDHLKERRLPDSTRTWLQGFGVWDLLRDNPEHSELALCPSASKLLHETAGTRQPWGDTFHSFRVKDRGFEGNKISYGINYWISIYSNSRGRSWNTFNEKGASYIPVFFDCATSGVSPYDACPPREFEHIAFEEKFFSNILPGTLVSDMSQVCINRHNGDINMLFMDWSVRKVGLKELWTLKWHRQYDTAGPWTKAGGVQASAWPAWMRRFQDY